MKKVRFGAMIGLLTLLCIMVAGCQSSGTVLDSLPTTGQASTTTRPTETEELLYTLCVTGKGGWPITDTHVTVYSDAMLSQRVTTVHTDSRGMASYTGKSGSTYYAVPNLNRKGYGVEPSYRITEAYTQIQLETKLVSQEYSAKPGDVMCEVDKEDWNGNRFVLSDVISAGKPCIIWWVDDPDKDYDPQLARLNKIYETYGDKLEILLYNSNYCWSAVLQSTKRQPIAFPAVAANGADPKWASGFSRVVVVDRYGLIVLMQNWTERVDEVGLQAIAEYITDENYRQERVFNAVSELQDYMDHQKAGADVTYRVKVTDACGNPMAGVWIYISYAYGGCGLETNEQGIAEFPLYLREDVHVKINRNVHDTRIYIMENEGFFAPGVTEKTVIMQEREKTTYTVRAVDTEGNPVRFVNIRTMPYGDFASTNEEGIYQWEGVIVEEPFEVQDSHTHPVPDGYVLGPVTREGDVFTILLYPMVTYTIKVVDQDGNPLDSVGVVFYEEGNEESLADNLTFQDGIAKVRTKEGKFLVHIYRKEYVDGEWYQWRYGVFVLEEGETEVTFVVGEPEIIKLH